VQTHGSGRKNLAGDEDDVLELHDVWGGEFGYMSLDEMVFIFCDWILDVISVSKPQIHRN